MSDLDRALELTRKAIEDFDDPTVPTSATLRRALRIASLRNDALDLYWLELEASDLGSKEPGGRRESAAVRAAELRGIDPDEWDAYRQAQYSQYCARRRRSADSDEIYGGSVEQLEQSIAGFEQERARAAAAPPAGLHQLDLAHRLQDVDQLSMTLMQAIFINKQILARVRARLYEGLLQAERELAFGQVNASVFDRNRQYVDGQLRRLSTQVLEQFQSAYRRLDDADPESLSHALTSCRRILKTVADAVYPATGDVVRGGDGKERRMTDDAYVNRLLQFTADQIGKHSTGPVLQATLDSLGQRLSALNSLASKGVHADVTRDEVDVCIIQTYLVVGDILRLRRDEPTEAAPR